MQADAQSPSPTSEGGQDDVVGQSLPSKALRETASLKRGREGSLEPNSHSDVPAQPPIVSKKNRVATSAETALPSNPTNTESPTKMIPPTGEANNIGEVRRKVEKMTWKEGEVKPEGYEPIEEDEAGELASVNADDIVERAEKGGRGTVEEDSMALSVKGEDEEETSGWEEIDAKEAVGHREPEDHAAIEIESNSTVPPEGLKRKALDRSQSSMIAAETSTEAKRHKDEESSTDPENPMEPPTLVSEPDMVLPTEAVSPPVPPKKPQTTFSSFSSSASPFASIRSKQTSTDASPVFGGSSSAKVSSNPFGSFTSSTSTQSSSPFAAFKSPSPAPVAPPPATTTAPPSLPSHTPAPVLPPSPFGAVKPVPKSTSVSDSTPSGTTAPPVKPSPSPFSSSGFGNYSTSSSPFASKMPVVPTSNEGDIGVKGKEGNNEAGPSKTASFGDILQSSGKDEGDEEADERTRMQMTEQDLQTGEEDEDTVYQSRVKLYVMQADGGWRERGVGTLRLNVRRQDGRGARLVMRAEGVLRLILNVSLYVGMPCLEDGKHVRMTVFEEKERRFITFRTGSQKAASELCQVIQEHTPLESIPLPTSSATSSFTSPRDSRHEDEEDDEEKAIGQGKQLDRENVKEAEDEEEELERESEKLERAERAEDKRKGDRDEEEE